MPSSSTDTDFWCSGWSIAKESFLFVFSRSNIVFPYKMKLKDTDDGYAVHHSASYGPWFFKGDLKV